MKDMVVTENLDQLILRVQDLGAIELELSEYERKVRESTSTDSAEMHSTIRQMMETTNKSKMFFEDQIRIISEISPPVADELDHVLDEYGEAQSTIEDKYREAALEGDAKPAEMIEILDEHVSELIGHYNKLRATIRLAYNCFAGAINFAESGTTQKARKRGRRGRKAS